METKGKTMCPYCTDMMKNAEIDLHIKEKHPALNQNSKLKRGKSFRSINDSPCSPETDAAKE